MNTFLTELIALAPVSAEILLPDPMGSPQGNADGNPPQGLLLVAPVPEASSMLAAGMLLLSFGVCSSRSFIKSRK
jgi:hypothetical protein